MSKNISVSIVLVVVALLSADHVVLGQQQNPILHVHMGSTLGIMDVIDYKGNPTTVVQSAGVLDGSYYNPSLNPWPTSHLTRVNNRIPHFVGLTIIPGTWYYFTPWGTISGDSAIAANRLGDTPRSILTQA